jgi:DNA (cytosine-5)-methyltransferase 1
VQADLEAEGYEVQPYVLPAVAVGSVHRRDRVWFVAYATSARNRQQQSKNCKQSDRQLTYNGEAWDASDSDRIRLEQCEDSGEMGRGQAEMAEQRDKPSDAIEADGKAANATDSDNARADIGMRTEREREEIDDRRERQSFPEYWKNGSDGDASDSDRRPTGTSGESCGIERGGCENDDEQSERGGEAEQHTGRVDVSRDAADTMLPRGGKDNGRGESKFFDENGEIGNWENFPTQSPICSGDDGLPTQLDGISFSKWRNESIKGYGNAVVPQVVHQIFKAIGLYESTSHETSQILTTWK